MQKKTLNLNYLWVRLLFFVLIVPVLISINGCASGNYGTLKRNAELNEVFVTSQVLPDYVYYYSGGYNNPRAILGIHKDYQLVPSSLWLDIEMTSAQMEVWIRTIDPGDHTRRGYFAYYILSPKGKQVGIWYSLQDHTTIKFLEGNRIEVYPPELFLPDELFLPGDEGPRRRGF